MRRAGIEGETKTVLSHPGRGERGQDGAPQSAGEQDKFTAKSGAERIEYELE